MLSEPPGADPHAGWCGRGQGEPGLYPIRGGGGRKPGQSTHVARPRRLPPTLPVPPEAAQKIPTGGGPLRATFERIGKHRGRNIAKLAVARQGAEA